jgi:hypothetical protein
MILMALLVSVMLAAAAEALERPEERGVLFQQIGMLRFISPLLLLPLPGTLLVVAVDGTVAQVVMQVTMDAHLVAIYILELHLLCGLQVLIIVAPIYILPKRIMEQNLAPEAEQDRGMEMAVKLLLMPQVELAEPEQAEREANLKLVRG